MDEAAVVERLARALDDAPAPPLTPALVIDLDVVEANIAAVLARVGSSDRWRPHVKTIKQGKIVDLLLDAGVRNFKCATLPELDLVLARADARALSIDVLLAHPVPAALVPALRYRAQKHHAQCIALLADDPDHLAVLDRAGDELGVWLDVDVGMHRTGSAAAVWERWAWAGRRPSKLALVGLHGYEGHLGWQDREAAFAGYDALAGLAQRVGDVGAILTSGSHGFDHALAHPGLAQGPWRHEIGCGTLVLSDVRSEVPAAALGVCQAAFVAARVVARPNADRITLDAGTKAIAPDRPAPSCRVLGRAELRPDPPSEEHLPVIVERGPAPDRDEILWLVPDHVCTTVNLYREAIYVRGDRYVGTGPIEAAGRPGPWYGSGRG